MQPGSELAKLSEEIERKYRPDQPRMPAGVREGGQWTSDAGTNTGGDVSGRNDPRVLSDANPENDAVPGAQYAQNRRPTGGLGRVIINGQELEPTPAQAARLVLAEAESRQLAEQVRQVDPNWKPAPSAYGTVEGLISSYQADAQQARNRLSELGSVGIGPGPYAGDSIPARGPGWSFTTAEREQINEIGNRSGCHTCGTKEPGTVPNNFVPDHQPPSALNYGNVPQRLYPQCLTCSLRQGGIARGLKK